MHPDKIVQQRTVYTFWDLTGDMGGLFDALKIIAGLFISAASALTGSNLDRFLISKLFKLTRKKEKTEGQSTIFTQIK